MERDGDLKVSDSSGSDRNLLRLPSERLLRRIETSGDLFAAEVGGVRLRDALCQR